MKRATRSVTDFACVFKGFCDQLHDIGCLVDNTDKVHWFLCGFGTEFQVSLLPDWPSLYCHHLLTLSPEPKALNYSKDHLNLLRHLLLLLPSLSQTATGSRGINHGGGPILDSNLAPLDSSPVISMQSGTQL